MDLRSFAIIAATATIFVALGADEAFSQELEPRAYSVSPTGTNFLVLGYGRSSGNIVVDAALPIEDASASISSVLLGYVRAFDFFGRSANIAVAAPYAWGKAQGKLESQFQNITRSGLSDSRFRFAVNLLGGPAMKLDEFAGYRQKTNVGASLTLRAPTGQYDPVRLVNLGANRWSFKPEIGVSHAMGKWFVDVYGGAWFFTENPNFQGASRKQRSIGTVQTHLVYSFRPGFWTAVNSTFFAGGRTILNDREGGDFQRNARIGVTLAVPLRRRHGLKFSWNTGAFTTIGADFRAVAVSYQYLWGGGFGGLLGS